MTTMVAEVTAAVFGREVAEGIVLLDDPFDGGYVLSEERNSRVHPAWRNAAGLYESVAETAVVVVTFPDVFSAAIVQQYAHANALWGFPEQYATVLGSEFTLREARGACSECGYEHRVWAGRSWMLCGNPANRCNGSVDLTTVSVTYKPL